MNKKNLLETVSKYPFFSGFLFLILAGKILFAVVSIRAVPAGFYCRNEFIAAELFSVLIYAGISFAILYLVSKRPFLRWIVLAVILSGLLYFAVSPRSQPFAHKHQCKDNLRKIADACLNYATDHQGYYPPSLEKLAGLKYINIETLHCPGNPWHNPGENDYLYHGAGQHRDTVPGNMVLLEDKPANHPEERFRSRLPASMF